MIHSAGSGLWQDIGARTMEVYGEYLQDEGGSHRLLTMVVQSEEDPYWEGFVVDSDGTHEATAQEVQEWREERQAELDKV